MAFAQEFPNRRVEAFVQKLGKARTELGTLGTNGHLS